MSLLPQELLSAALRLKWESGHAGDERAVELLAERLPGFTAAQYAEASRRANSLDGMAYELAAGWFASKGQGSFPQAEVLETAQPGFAAADYMEAIQNNVLWARK